MAGATTRRRLRGLLERSSRARYGRRWGDACGRRCRSGRGLGVMDTCGSGRTQDLDDTDAMSEPQPASSSHLSRRPQPSAPAATSRLT